ncbi:MAG: hypothetical protein LBS42_00975 [Tannerella sp.]|jgi:hypothetical protein|nr:hypothetical protein [Tannerella sp.]
MYDSGLGPEALLGLVLGIVFWVWIFWVIFQTFSRNKTVHLALSRFIVDPQSEIQIVLEGRKTGLIQWVLVQFKLGNMYRLHIRKDYISYSANSASGEDLLFTPVQKIASTSCGYHQPIGLLISAAIIFLAGIIFTVNVGADAFLVFSAIALIFVVLYYFKKRFFIAITTVGGEKLGFSFKRSYIENVAVDIEKVKEAIGQINALVLNVQ